ncbi:oligosaccharide repeat unit polymerase [Mordavella massiliensis]|uniref:O-antigen polymerase n=1 Tax=Mordavella massiliensis TaxID=1871024 RepID=UPI00210EEF5F|nr:oligosaccharide repeat unit polymerase [Mordavella massiliensis]
MILILFVGSLLLAFIAKKNSLLAIMSPTFWASGMVAFFSLIYICTYSTMLGDLHLITVVVMLGALLATYFGEYVGCRVVFRKTKTNTKNITPHFENKTPIIVSKSKTVILTVVFTIIGIMRYRSLGAFASVYAGVGGFKSAMEMMSYARLGYVQAGTNISLGGTFANQFVYLCEICAYIYIFIFFYNYLVCKKINLYLLLPILPDVLIRFVTTTRSAYIILVISIVAAFFSVSQRMGKKWILFSPKLLKIVFVFAIVLIWYGRSRNDVSISMTRYLQMYTCSSLYALDSFLIKNTSNSPYFGYYTLQSIYSLLRITHDTVPVWNPDVIFGINGAATNIYTCLYDTVNDFGIVGMLFVKFIEAIISGAIIKRFLNSDVYESKYYVLIYFVVAIEYCYLNFPIGHAFTGYFGSPDLMLRYLVYCAIIVKLVFMPTINAEGKIRIGRFYIK